MNYPDEVDKSAQHIFSACENNVDTVTVVRKIAEQNGNQKLIPVLNAMQFVSVCNYDLSCLSHDLHTMKPGWKRNLQARVAVLLLVEYMESIGGVMGSQFRVSAESLYENPADDEKRLNEISKTLHCLRNEHDKDLRKLRNLAMAHREKDAQTQLAAIEEMDIEYVAGIMAALTEWTTLLLNFFTYLVSRIYATTTSDGQNR